MIQNLIKALEKMTTDELIHEMVNNSREILDRQEQNEIITREIITRGSEKDLSDSHELFLFLNDTLGRR